MSCAKSVDVIVPVFNLDTERLEYVVNEFLAQDIDRVIIANTGDKETGLADYKRIVEVHGAPLPEFYPGYTRNMGASVSARKSEVQVHTGADIIPLHGEWGVFRNVVDGECVAPKCRILDPDETEQATMGQRKFNLSRLYLDNTSTIAMTRHTAIYRLGGPFDWAMKRWGAVDPDLKRRAEKQGIVFRWVDIATAHLFHKGGCEEIFFKGKYPRDDPDFLRNRQLMKIKETTKGWWS